MPDIAQKRRTQAHSSVRMELLVTTQRRAPLQPGNYPKRAPLKHQLTSLRGSNWSKNRQQGTKKSVSGALCRERKRERESSNCSLSAFFLETARTVSKKKQMSLGAASAACLRCIMTGKRAQQVAKLLSFHRSYSCHL